MPLSLDVTVVRARIPVMDRILSLPSLPPETDCSAWLESAALCLKRQNAPRLMGGVQLVIRLEDAHPRRCAQHAIAPVLALLIKSGVLVSDRAHALRRVAIEWAPIPGVEIHIRRAS